MTKKEAMEKRYLTLDDLRQLDFDMLTPAIVAKYLRCDKYAINVQARQDKSRLGFNVIQIGSRVLIPREGFIKFAEGC